MDITGLNKINSCLQLLCYARCWFKKLKVALKE
jgi:hypothetical protein